MVTQSDALATTLAAVGLGVEHAALVALCEGIAEEIDRDQGFCRKCGTPVEVKDASLFREYRAALGVLAEAAAANGQDDGQAELLRLVSTPVGDATKSGKKDARPRARRNSGDARSAADAVAATGRGRRPRATG